MFSLQGFDYDTLSQRILGRAKELGASYCDLRFNWSAATVIRVRNGEVETCNRGFSSGLGVKVIKDGAWGFASSGNISERDALNLVEEACKIASNTKGKDVKLASVKIYEDRVSTPLRIDPNDISLESKVKTVLEAEEAARKYHPSIASTTASYIDISTHQYFASSEGAKIDSEITRVFTTLYVAAKEGSVISPSYEAIGGTRGYELVEKNPPEGLVKEVCERAVRLLKASPPPPGEYTAVMDPKILGLMIHEAFGHTAEADLVLSGDILSGKIGEKVASEDVTVIDDGSVPGALGSIPYDDEGVKTGKTIIVEKGILKSYMHTRETAHILQAEPTGNARAQSYNYEPIVRMRNTYVDRGDWSPEEIIEETRHGFYLKGGIGGQADVNGVFMFSVQEAFDIENGELKEPYRAVSISGRAIDVLKSVDAVGRDLAINSPGVCGKLQSAYVDGGGPHIRCRIKIGGRRE